jgi:O-antigen/teichoic acid export membrane protein
MLFKLKLIFQKLKNPHIINLISIGVMALLGFVQAAILTNYLSIKVMGVWYLYQGTIGLIDVFRSGLLTTALITSYTGTSKERAAEVAGSGWYLAIVVTGLFAAINVIYLLFPFHIGDAGYLLFFKLFGLVFVITLPSFIASCIAQAEQRFDRLFYIRALSTGLSIILVLLLIITGKLTLETSIYAGIIAAAATSLLTLVLGWSRLGTLRYKSTQTVKALFAFGKFSVGTSLGSNLFRYSDTFIINILLGPSSLAIYNLGLRFMEFVEIPLRSFAGTVMPLLSGAHNQDNKSHVIYVLKKYSGLLTILLVPVVIGALLLSDVAIWIYDSKYLGTGAANVLRIFMTFALIYPVERFMALTLDSINQPKVNMIKLIFMLIANIVGDLLGVWLFGNVYGVALATILPILTGLVISYTWLQKYFKFSFWDVYKIGWLECNWLIRDALATIKKKKADAPAQ